MFHEQPKWCNAIQKLQDADLTKDKDFVVQTYATYWLAIGLKCAIVLDNNVCHHKGRERERVTP